MIAERITWKLKPGCKREAIEMLKSSSEPSGPVYRVYSFMFGGNGETVVLELEFETLEDRQKFWADWSAQPESAEVAARFQELMETGGVHELLRVQ